MPPGSLPWRVGAFADRYPRAAQDVGRALKAQAGALRLLYSTAGATSDSAIVDSAYGYPPSYGPCTPSDVPRGCCGTPPCPGHAQGVDSACARGTCCCAEGDEDFAAIYPEAAAELDNAAAFAAALRDINADPDVSDVGAAVDQARALFTKGKLAAAYAPAVPAKPLPSGAPAPARCPICGASCCPACGDCCCCVTSEHPEEMPTDPAGE